MLTMGILSVTLVTLLVGDALGQYYGGNPFYGGTPSAPVLPTQCFTKKQDSSAFCRAQGSCEYQGYNYGFTGPYSDDFAVDGMIVPWNSGFFHSCYCTYPWLKVTFYNANFAAVTALADPVKAVVVTQRCDANSIYHYTQFESRWSPDEHGIGAFGGCNRLTAGNVCGIYSGVMFAGCSQFQIACAAPAAAAKEFSLQKLTLHSHGQGWPNYGSGQWNAWSGNSPAQNANVPASFLMVNEIWFIG